MKTILVLLSLYTVPCGLMANTSGDTITSTNPVDSEGRIVGRVVDGSTKQPVDYATVAVKSLTDSATVVGGLTAEGGKFNVDKLQPGKYEVSITFLGYQTLSKTVEITEKQKQLDLGEIKISPDEKTLEAVQVTADKQQMMMGIDRKVFDVEKNSITTGGTALDVLRQIPTLQVDVDGNISLRGSDNITIFINGKNTGISGQNLAQVLKSMPASSVKNVELITNPSAKYDAAGMNGIINIITKKSITPGNFGSATISVGNNDKYNLSGSWNATKGKLATSNTLSTNSFAFKHKAFNERDNFLEGQPAFSTNNKRKGLSVNDGVYLNGNVDYTFNPKNSLSFAYFGGVSRGRLTEINNYEFLNAAKQPYLLYNRTANNHFNSPNLDAGLTYTKNFDTEKKNELVISGNVSSNIFDDRQTYLQENLTLTGEGDGSNPYNQHIDLYSKTNNYTGQADYTKGIGENGKFEAGFKSNYRYLDNNLYSDSLNYSTGGRDKNTVISNDFSYNELINAAYLNYSGMLGKWGYQGGLRAEQTLLEIYQASVGNDPIKRDYTNIFPSVFLSRKWENGLETQVSYSKRINRPPSGFLNPFADYTDPLNVRMGNAYLKPEYVNAIESSVMKYWTAHSLTATVYYRNINSVFQRIREVNANGISKVSFNNFGHSNNMGVELIARNKITAWWINTTNFNLYRTVLEGQTAVKDYATDAINWNVRIMSSFRFWKNADIQLSGNYLAPVRIPQGYYYGFSGVDLGFKKDIWDGKASVGFNIQDILNTKKFYVSTKDFNYQGKTEFKRETQWVSVNFTYKFGKPGEGQQPRRNRQQQQGGGGQNQNMGL